MEGCAHVSMEAAKWRPEDISCLPPLSPALLYFKHIHFTYSFMYLFVCVRMHACMHAYACLRAACRNQFCSFTMWVFRFYKTEVFRLGSKHLDALGHLISQLAYSFKTGSLIECELHILALLAGQQVPRICLFLLISAGIISTWSHRQTFVGTGDSISCLLACAASPPQPYADFSTDTSK